VLQGAQYVYVTALGFAAGVPAPITFALCAAIALHYADIGAAGSPVVLAARHPGSVLYTRRGGSSRPARSRQPSRQRFGRLLAPQQPQPQPRAVRRPAPLPGRRLARPPEPGASPGSTATTSPAGTAGTAGTADTASPIGTTGTTAPAWPPQPPLLRAQAEVGGWMGWEGRMIICGLGAAMGIAWLAFLGLAAYLCWLIWGKIRASYFGLGEAGAR
jgi:hypothetical protein